MKDIRTARLETPGPEELARAAAALLAGVGAPALLLVLLAEASADELEAKQRALVGAALGHPFLGGVFPALIDGAREYEAGALLVALPRSGVIHRLEAGERRALLSELGRAPAPAPGSTALVLVDGLTASTAPFLEALATAFGASVSYWGGGAGSLGGARRPCLFSDDGCFLDAALVGFTSLPAQLGVRHGWREVAGPLFVTRARGNRIIELNWEPALSVYAQAVLADSGRELDIADFAAIAKSYPFGITRQGTEMVVRDPLAAEPDGSLVCVGDVPENTAVAVLRGEASELIAAAAGAAADAATAPGHTELVLVADCISRRSFLGERFGEELQAIGGASVGGDEPAAVGMLTLGEVASHGAGYLDFFNKTAVVAALTGGLDPEPGGAG